jgi:hypothetical protein
MCEHRGVMHHLRAVLVALTLAACGADTGLGDPALDAGGGGADGGDAAAPVRGCPPECAVGHHCCVGSCDGAAVVLPSDCCECLPGEVSSFQCANDTCGG